MEFETEDLFCVGLPTTANRNQKHRQTKVAVGGKPFFQ